MNSGNGFLIIYNELDVGLWGKARMVLCIMSPRLIVWATGRKDSQTDSLGYGEVRAK